MITTIYFIGAGGHAKVVYEVALALGLPIHGFCDPKIDHFFDLQKIDETVIERSQASCVLSIGGVTPATLETRKALFDHYKVLGLTFPTLTAPTAYVSKTAVINEGVFINQGAIIQSATQIGEAVIINTRALVEHDVSIGEGSHIAPGAILLGNCRIGKNCMIGAGAVILVGSIVPDGTLVPALTRFPKKEHLT